MARVACARLISRAKSRCLPGKTKTLLVNLSGKNGVEIPMSARSLPLFPKAIFICGFVIKSALCLTILIYADSPLLPDGCYFGR